MPYTPITINHENLTIMGVSFPDFESCYTCGDDMAHALEMAEDVLCLTLYDMEKDRKEVPPPSDSKAIRTDGIVSLVRCDTGFYRRFYENKSVKKTLSIPMWLNERAERENVNFSGILQEALKSYLQIQE